MAGHISTDPTPRVEEMVGPFTHTPFFNTDSELADIESHVRRLQASVHAPPTDRAERVLADVQRAILSTHEAQLQLNIASSAGFDEHRQLWQGKLDDLDQRIADATAALHGLVEELRLVRFQRFAAAMVIGVVALRHLFTPPVDGQPPLISQEYLAGTGFISDGPAAR